MRFKVSLLIVMSFFLFTTGCENRVETAKKLWNQNKREEAVAKLTEELKKKPENTAAKELKQKYESGIIIDNARDLLKLENYELAINLLEKEVLNYPKVYDFYYLLARAKAKLGKKEEAIKYYQTALRINKTPFRNSVSGKVVDHNGEPLAGVKVTANQKEQIEGYELIEATTNDDGTFKVEKMFPVTDYELTVSGERGTTAMLKQINAGLDGKELNLDKPFIARYFKDEEGIITDTGSELQWFKGPIIKLNEAVSWVNSLQAGGGGWRMAAFEELRSLYDVLEESLKEFKKLVDAKKITSDNSPDIESLNLFVLLGMESGTVWFDESNSRLCFDFRNGKTSYYCSSLFARPHAIAVRWTPRKYEENLFTKNSEGIITDSETGLQWIVGPDKSTNWNQATAWVKTLTIGGGWRMPTRKELRSLYFNGVGDRNMPPAFKTTGWGVWSGETQGSSGAWRFGFSIGEESSGTRSYSDLYRAFAVRARR